MSKQKSIAEQITEIQEANQKLSAYEKLLDKAIQIRFGQTSKAIKKLLLKKEESHSDFETTICKFFLLKTEEDKKEFISLMCTESSKNYYNCKRTRQ